MQRHRQYKKILEIGPVPPPHTGWRVRIHHLLAEMRRRGIEYAVLDRDSSGGRRRTAFEKVRNQGDFAWNVVRYLVKGYRIHNHANGNSLAGCLKVLHATVLSSFFRRPAVLTWHGGLGYRWFPSRGNRFVDATFKLLFRLSERIVCNHEEVKEVMLQYGIPSEKIIPIPAFSCQYLEFRHVSLPDDAEDFLAEHSPVVFSYIKFKPSFYPAVVVEAFERIAKDYPDIGLFIIGSGEEWNRWHADWKEAGLHEQVMFIDSPHHDAFMSLLGRSDIFLRTQKRDGTSSSVLEALHMKIPVVAADNALRPPSVYTYEASDAEALSETIMKVLALPESERLREPPACGDTIGAEIEVITNNYPMTAVRKTAKGCRGKPGK